MNIASITIQSRFRRDLGDLSTLYASIAALGLLHSIVVNTDATLIAGQRRLAACKLLGWHDIPVTVIDLEDAVRAEHDENVLRKDFLPSEAVAIAEALKPMEEAAALERKAEGGRGANLAPLDTGKARDKVAKYVGIGQQ